MNYRPIGIKYLHLAKSDCQKVFFPDFQNHQTTVDFYESALKTLPLVKS